jgi:monomeric sarcosine oxidase
MARIAVLGAGGVGSATARFLAREGHSVSVFEQFGIDDERVSSYGSSRLIRKTYADDFYVSLMEEAYPLWQEFEQEAGERLFIRTGGLFFGPAEHPDLAAMRSVLKARGLSFEELDAAACVRKFPQLRLRNGEAGILEPDAGLLHASACVRINLRLATAHGAQVHTHTPVEDITPHPDHLTLRLKHGQTHKFDRLVITAGPWTARLLARHIQLPFTVTRQFYCHFKPDGPAWHFGAGRFPVWIDFATNFYGFPEHGKTAGVKVARHHPGVTTDPDAVDRAGHEEDRKPLRDYCAERLPGLSSRTVFEKVCLYTMTPDSDFVVDTLPGEPRISFVGGLSGHGFKFTVLLGRIAAWMATDRPAPWALNRFSLARFR